MKIDGSVAVVSGGASGLGRATTEMLVHNGGRVAILDRDEDRGRAMAQQLGGGVMFCPVDVTDDGAVADAVTRAVDAFGAIHIAVSCAGVGAPAKVLGRGGTPLDMDVFRWVVDVNLFGTMNVVRLAAEQMLRNEPQEDGERGVIVMTASNAATEGQIGQASYTASKAAVSGMTLPIAREFAEYGMRVNTISPGLFDTPLLRSLPDDVLEALGEMVPFPRRLGRPAEYASLVREIVTNRMINGEAIRLDGAVRMAAR